MSDRHIQTPPTKERMKKPDIGEIAGTRGGKEIRSVRHPLDYYQSRDILTRPQWAAGTRYSELWEIGYQRSQHAQSRYGDPMTRGEFNPAFADECRSLYDRASLILRDMSTRKLVFDVCCQGQWAGPDRLSELKSGLDALDKHFHRCGRMD